MEPCPVMATSYQSYIPLYYQCITMLYYTVLYYAIFCYTVTPAPIGPADIPALGFATRLGSVQMTYSAWMMPGR